MEDERTPHIVRIVVTLCMSVVAFKPHQVSLTRAANDADAG